jgi:hypothetical protein
MFCTQRYKLILSSAQKVLPHWQKQFCINITELYSWATKQEPISCGLRPITSANICTIKKLLHIYQTISISNYHHQLKHILTILNWFMTLLTSVIWAQIRPKSGERLLEHYHVITVITTLFGRRLQQKKAF